MKKYALLGNSLGHTLSPALHGDIFRSLGIDGSYEVLDVAAQDLPLIFQSSHFVGLNVTLPYKQKVMEYLSDLSDEVQTIQAVNTISFQGKQRIGHNTDYYGFASMLKENQCDPYQKSATILGYGGAAKAVIACLLDQGITHITIASRQTVVVDDPRISFLGYEALARQSATFLINTTPLGMFPHINAAAAGSDTVRNHEVVIDLIYNPSETLLMAAAKKAGKKTVGGIDMLVYQAIRAQELWHHQTIPVSVIAPILNKYRRHYDT